MGIGGEIAVELGGHALASTDEHLFTQRQDLADRCAPQRDPRRFDLDVGGAHRRLGCGELHICFGGLHIAFRSPRIGIRGVCTGFGCLHIGFGGARIGFRGLRIGFRSLRIGLRLVLGSPAS